MELAAFVVNRPWVLRNRCGGAAAVGWSHQLPDRVEHHLELVVIPTLHLLKPLRKIAMRCEYLPQLDERAHDRDVYLNRSGTTQDAGKHGHALLGEGIGSGTPRG